MESATCGSNCSGEVGRGECEGGECSCQPYGCWEGRCFETKFEAAADFCKIPEDRCVNNTCVSVVCEPGLCNAQYDNCVEGVCVPPAGAVGNISLDQLECFPVTLEKCTANYVQFFAQPDCALSQEASIAAQLVVSRETKVSQGLQLQSLWRTPTAAVS